MSPWPLALCRLRALGYSLAPGALDDFRLRSVERNLRRRGHHRDAQALHHLASSVEARRAAHRVALDGFGYSEIEARQLLVAADFHHDRARFLLAQEPRP